MIIINMYTSIYICNELHVYDALPRRHASLSFEKSVIILINNTEAVSVFDNSHVNFLFMFQILGGVHA